MVMRLIAMMITVIYDNDIGNDDDDDDSNQWLRWWPVITQCAAPRPAPLVSRWSRSVAPQRTHLVIIGIRMVVIIIIITRPKPAYGRQGLAGSWGQDTDEVSTFLVFLTSHFAPAALSSDLTNLGPLMTMKIHLETLKNHETNQKPWNYLEKPWKPTKTMKTHETTMKNHGNQPGYSLGRVHSWEKPTWNRDKPTWDHEKPWKPTKNHE